MGYYYNYYIHLQQQQRIGLGRVKASQSEHRGASGHPAVETRRRWRWHSGCSAGRRSPSPATPSGTARS